MPWWYLSLKSHCWKAHFFMICFVSLLLPKNVQLRKTWHGGRNGNLESSLCLTQCCPPPMKNSGYAPEDTVHNLSVWPHWTCLVRQTFHKVRILSTVADCKTHIKSWEKWQRKKKSGNVSIQTKDARIAFAGSGQPAQLWHFDLMLFSKSVNLLCSE